MITWRETEKMLVTDIYEFKVYLNRKGNEDWELVCTPLGFYSFHIYAPREDAKALALLWIRNALEGQLIAIRSAIAAINETQVTLSVVSGESVK